MFVATSHRVRRVAEERYCLPLFFALDYDTQLRPLGVRDAEPIRTAEHLFAQTVQTIHYLREQAAGGKIALPPEARPVSSFGQAARQTESRHNPSIRGHQSGAINPGPSISPTQSQSGISPITKGESS